MMFEWSMHGDCISIYGIYIAPLQGALLRGAPSPGPGKNKSFKELVKRAGQIPWKRADFRWETIPNRGTHNGNLLVHLPTGFRGFHLLAYLLTCIYRYLLTNLLPYLSHDLITKLSTYLLIDLLVYLLTCLYTYLFT